MIGNKTVVYTSGTFDMLHVNHLKMLEYARSLGDILIVGVNTDELVASYKSIPIVPFEERIALLKAIKGPDIVVPQRELDHTEKVKKLHFDIFVVGDDWAGKYDYLEKLSPNEDGHKVSVVYCPYGEEVSTSKIKEKILANYKVLQDKANSHLPVELVIKE